VRQLLLLALLPAAAHAQGLEVRNLKATTNGEVEFDLVNTAKQPIVTWFWESEAKLPDGSATGGGSGEDVYHSMDRPAATGEGPIQPGEARRMKDTIDPAATDLKITVTAVVFADGTAKGDPDTLDRIEQRRLEEAEAHRRMLELTRSLTDQLKNGMRDPIPELDRILASIDAVESRWVDARGQRRAHKGGLTNSLLRHSVEMMRDNLKAAGPEHQLQLLSGAQHAAARQAALALKYSKLRRVP
jgi:hypothetical protein